TIGTKVFNDLEFQREDAALAVDSGTRTHHILARMACSDQIFVAVLAPTHRPAQLTRYCRDGQFLAIERDLLAEAAADVGRDDGDLGFGEPQAAGELRAVGMRHLAADVHGEMTPPLIPNRTAAARLDWRVGLTVLAE